MDKPRFSESQLFPHAHKPSQRKQAMLNLKISELTKAAEFIAEAIAAYQAGKNNLGTARAVDADNCIQVVFCDL